VLSADNAHAVHPNFADKADPCNKVILGKGVVVKVNASQKYTTSGLTGAIFKEICRKNNVPVQVFANRADLPGGSTLGNLQSHTVPVPMVDIGLAQLAMHSAVETAAVADADAMVRAVAGFYRVHLRSLAMPAIRWNEQHSRALCAKPQRADAPGQPVLLPAGVAFGQKQRRQGCAAH